MHLISEFCVFLQFSNVICVSPTAVETCTPRSPAHFHSDFTLDKSELDKYTLSLCMCTLCRVIVVLTVGFFCCCVLSVDCKCRIAHSKISQ